jgi:hypothetical protein
MLLSFSLISSEISIEATDGPAGHTLRVFAHMRVIAP